MCIRTNTHAEHTASELLITAIHLCKRKPPLPFCGACLPKLSILYIYYSNEWCSAGLVFMICCVVVIGASTDFLMLFSFGTKHHSLTALQKYGNEEGCVCRVVLGLAKLQRNIVAFHTRYKMNLWSHCTSDRHEGLFHFSILNN